MEKADFNLLDKIRYTYIITFIACAAVIIIKSIVIDSSLILTNFLWLLCWFFTEYCFYSLRNDK